MKEVAETLERNAKEVLFGSVSVEIRIYEGKPVKTIYRVENTTVKKGKINKENNDGGNETGN